MVSAYVRAGCAAVGITITTFGGVAAPRDQSQEMAAEAPRISVIEFAALHAAGAVLVVDVRPATPFDAGHIPGAINVPLADIGDRASEIGRRAGARRIVTYCSCAAESSSAAAARELARRGIRNVSALAGGLDEWILKGGRTEKTVRLATRLW